MTTLMLLLARHDGQEEIPFRVVSRDYFGLEPDALERKIKLGVINFEFPDGRQRSIRSCNVPLICLARYVQNRRSAALLKMEEYASLVQE